MRSRRVLVLLCVTLALAVFVIDMRHRNRLKFAELQSLRAERDALDVEWGQLLLEQGAWSEHRRVEGMARVRLNMTLPRSEQVTVVYREVPHGP